MTKRRTLIHVESRYATDAYSTRVSTICGRYIKRALTVRFKSDANPDKTCIQCLRRSEEQ